MTEMSPADYAAVNGNNMGMGGSWIWLIVLFFLFGGRGFGYGNAELNQVNNDFLYTNLSNQLGRGQDRIENTLNTGFTAVAQGQFGLSKELCQGFAGVQAGISEIIHNQDKCCCDLKTAIHAEGEMTRNLITQNVIQDLRDRVQEKDNMLQSANLTIQNNAQTRTIVDSLQPTPKPAYVVASPYVSYGYNPCGCGCGSCSYS